MWKPILHSFFNCIVCHTSLGHSPTFPACSTCIQSLLLCPELCPTCGTPQCRQAAPVECLFPWRKKTSIDSYSALYLMIGKSYQVLKKWKIHSGPLFDRQILIPNTPLTTKWREFQPQAIVPLPQLTHRLWQMNGSRPKKLAQWISRHLGVPDLALLSRDDSQARRKRQAELNLEQRLHSHLHFQGERELFQLFQPRRVILVDDFRTTGRTLTQASEALIELGVHHVHIFSLGVRLSRLNS